MVLEKPLPKKPEKEVISTGIPTEVLALVDAKAAAWDISRNEFLNRCIAFALAHADDIAVPFCINR